MFFYKRDYTFHPPHKSHSLLQRKSLLIFVIHLSQHFLCICIQKHYNVLFMQVLGKIHIVLKLVCFFLIIYPGKCFISVYVHLLHSFNCYSSINKLTMSGPTGCFQYWIIPFILQETSLHIC